MSAYIIPLYYIVIVTVFFLNVATINLQPTLTQMIH